MNQQHLLIKAPFITWQCTCVFPSGRPAHGACPGRSVGSTKNKAGEGRHRTGNRGKVQPLRPGCKVRACGTWRGSSHGYHTQWNITIQLN